MSLIKLVMAQINSLVGDIEGNTQAIINYVLEAQSQQQADIVVFPELTLCGYPPEDLLLRDSMSVRIQAAMQLLAEQEFSAAVILGYPQYSSVTGGSSSELTCHNMAGVLQKGEWTAEYAKQYLPNYQVFDEKRYFTAGDQACVLELKGVMVSLSICEDIWFESSVRQAQELGAEMVISLNASPFHQRKQEQRLTLLSTRARQGDVSILYVNQVGGQDELVFDGGSMAVDIMGNCQVSAPLYESGLYAVTYDTQQKRFVECNQLAEAKSELGVIYDALVLGLKDYVNKNHFKSVVLGLSGGIDSALTLAIAVDALGAERVSAIMMPFRYTSQLSKDDAAEQAQRMGVAYDSISIEPMYNAFMQSLESQFEGLSADLTEQNLQARCRGVVLMAVSNKKGALVLTTGNKSELAVGYSTLYGDMAGGFDALKDVPKTTVFALSEYRNTVSEVIPRSVIDRPPSAELAPDQKDEDNLPPYDILDQILTLYVEQDVSADNIIAQGFDAETVRRVVRLVDLNEYKRRQSPIGVRISQKGFGRDRRYPITNGWKAGK